MVRERGREKEASNVRPELGNSGDRCHVHRNNEFSLTAALHATHFAFIGLLIGLVQVKYQNRTDSPFETCSELMTISVITLAFYGLAIGLKIIVVLDSTYRQSYAQSILVTYVTTVSGGLSSVSLLSVLIQDKLRWLVFLIWAIFIATAAYYSFKFLSQLVYNCIFNAIFQAINMLRHMFTNLMGFRSIQQQHSTGTTTSV